MGHPVAIMLSRFKASFEDIHKAILTLDESVLDYEKVLKLMEFVPTKEEIDQIVDYPEEKYTFFFSSSSSSSSMPPLVWPIQ